MSKLIEPYWKEVKDSPVCKCSNCNGWGFNYMPFCPWCGKGMNIANITQKG